MCVELFWRKIKLRRKDSRCRAKAKKGRFWRQRAVTGAQKWSRVTFFKQSSEGDVLVFE
jgi:hypothetical protein